MQALQNRAPAAQPMGNPVDVVNALQQPMPVSTNPYQKDIEAIGATYPALQPHLKNLQVQAGVLNGPTDDRKLEFYQPWESDNPNPGKLTTELFDPIKAMSPSDRQETIAGDMLHHLGALDPSTGVPVDKKWWDLKQELGSARTPGNLESDQRAYAREKANTSYETQPVKDWDQNNRLDAYVRAGVFPNQNSDWQKPHNQGPEIGQPFLTSKMQEIYGRMKNYLSAKGPQ